MANRITEKTVQVIEQWPGRTEVYQDTFPIRWIDFKKAGIKRRIDKTTGKPFLAMVMRYDYEQLTMF